MWATPFRLDSTCLPLHRLAAFEQTILDGIQDLLLVLAPDGRVLHASQMCFALTTLTPKHLLGNHIANFMHYDDLSVFLDQFKTCMHAGKPWRFHHRLRRADDTFAVFESTFNPFFDQTSAHPPEFFGLHKCVMTIRPYSNPSAILMDSYLDHFTTNIRLVQQLNQLRSEADTPDEEDGGQSVHAVDDCLSSTAEIKTKTIAPSNELLRKAAQKSALECNRGFSNHVLAKLDCSGDVGIKITASRLETIEKTGSWAAKPCLGKKRKNAKLREHICTECGTKDSPEWRTGSRGKKSLCNACGLRWAKASKREVLEATTAGRGPELLECVS